MQNFSSQTPRVIYRHETSPTLELASVPVRTSSGEAQHWHLLTAQDGQPGVVCLVVHEQLLLIGRHWRLPERRKEWEFPRGFGEPGETTEDSARREVLEETGLNTSAVRVLGRMFADSGLLGNAIDVVLVEVTDGVDDRRPSADDELTSLTWVSTDQLTTMIRDGEIRDGITLAAFAMLQAAQP